MWSFFSSLLPESWSFSSLVGTTAISAVYNYFAQGKTAVDLWVSFDRGVADRDAAHSDRRASLAAHLAALPFSLAVASFPILMELGPGHSQTTWRDTGNGQIPDRYEGVLEIQQGLFRVNVRMRTGRAGPAPQDASSRRIARPVSTVSITGSQPAQGSVVHRSAQT